MNTLDQLNHLAALTASLDEAMLLEDQELITLQGEINELIQIAKMTSPEHRNAPEIVRVMSEVERRLQLYLIV
jgi:hypothetical protein